MVTSTAQQQIDALYQSVLGRQADSGGEQFYANLLNSGTSLADIKAQLANSSEGKTFAASHPSMSSTPANPAPGMAYAQGVPMPSSNTPASNSNTYSDPVQQSIENIYKSMLGRDVDPSGLATYTNAVKSGKMSLQDVGRTLFGSDEFSQSHPGVVNHSLTGEPGYTNIFGSAKSGGAVFDTLDKFVNSKYFPMVAAAIVGGAGGQALGGAGGMLSQAPAPIQEGLDSAVGAGGDLASTDIAGAVGGFNGATTGLTSSIPWDSSALGLGNYGWTGAGAVGSSPSSTGSTPGAGSVGSTAVGGLPSVIGSLGGGSGSGAIGGTGSTGSSLLGGLGNLLTGTNSSGNTGLGSLLGGVGQAGLGMLGMGQAYQAAQSMLNQNLDKLWGYANNINGMGQTAAANGQNNMLNVANNAYNNAHNLLTPYQTNITNAAQQAANLSKYTPANITSGYGSANFDSNGNANMSLSAPYQSARDQLLGQANQYGNQINSYGNDFVNSTYNNLRQMASFNEQQDRTNLENRLAAQGMLGSTGGGIQSQALLNSQNMADVDRQVQATQLGDQLQNSLLSRQTTALNGASTLDQLPLQNASLGMQIGAQNLGANQYAGNALMSGATTNAGMGSSLINGLFGAQNNAGQFGAQAGWQSTYGMNGMMGTALGNYMTDSGKLASGMATGLNGLYSTASTGAGNALSQLGNNLAPNLASWWNS